MKRARSAALLGTLILSLAIATPHAAAAAAADPTPVEDPLLIPEELPAGVIDGEPNPEYRTDGSPPNDVSQALMLLSLNRPDLRIAGTEWNSETGELLLYSAADEATVFRALADSKLREEVQYRSARLDSSEKSAIGTQIAGKDGILPSGHRVVSVSPSLDGSSVSVVLDETAGAEARMDISTVENQIAEALGERVEVEVELGPPAEAATRNHAANPSTFSGAVMRKTGTTGICTTGFRMTQISGTVPVMGSAHHCHQGIENQAWHYTQQSDGSLWPAGNAFSIYGAGLSNGDVSIWKGPIADHMLPAIFIGDHTVAGSNLYSIKGAIGNPIGATVCYSGSLTGTMCGNTITNSGETVCYGGGLPCYNNIVRTQQVTNKPAAGKGDSGGPVYGTNSGIYAAGIISGISAPTADCTGEPGSTAPNGRVCSPIVLYAPVTELMANGYGLNYIP